MMILMEVSMPQVMWTAQMRKWMMQRKEWWSYCARTRRLNLVVSDSYQFNYYPESCGEDNDLQNIETHEEQEVVYYVTDDDIYYEMDGEGYSQINERAIIDDKEPHTTGEWEHSYGTDGLQCSIKRRRTTARKVVEEKEVYEIHEEPFTGLILTGLQNTLDEKDSSWHHWCRCGK